MSELPFDRVKTVHILHVAAVSLAVAAVLCIISASLSSTAAPDAAWTELTRWLQRAVLFPGLLAALVTGAILTSERSLRFFREPWIVVKWSVGSVLLALSIFLLEPAAEIRGVLLQAQGLAALVHPLFVAVSRLALVFEVILVAGLLFLVVVGARKPWRKTPRIPRTGRVVKAMVFEEEKRVREPVDIGAGNSR